MEQFLTNPLFQALFNSPVPRIIVMANAPEFTILISNDAHKSVTNLVGRNITGKSVWEIFDPNEAGGDGGILLKDALTEAQQTNKTILMPPFRYDMNAPDGKGMVEKWWQLEIMPIGGDDTTPEYLLTTTNSITDQVFKEREREEFRLELEKLVEERTHNLERAYEQVHLSKLAAQLGTFDMDLVRGHMEWDARCRELFGIAHNAEVTYEKDFLSGLHPDDRVRITTIIDKLFRMEISDGIYDVEYRTIGAEDNRLRWVRAKGKVYFDGVGQPMRFIGSVLDITDQKHEEQLRNDFIAIASHELKTPLTSLQGYIQYLYRKARKSEDHSNLPVLSQAEKQVIKMSKMINGFLNLSRLESGKLHLNLSEVPVMNLIEEVVADVTLAEPDINILIARETRATAVADPDKIAHVILNLLTNAVKYAEKEKPVTISCDADDEQVTVSVRDEGIGINPSDQERIFDRFHRAGNPETNFVSGFGIGLYLSREIVMLHGGNIWVDSQPGAGSTFSFSIPLAGPPQR
ncbi:PAS domain-containing sensor histidine kinase [Pedobacter deserti]|uniref:PAS domain-containing sensor histidine kinase n=1 Tax=Pedobacter deserti TaxID=2817382 RepID=UPI0021092C70|nr:sensor histidine kinase [Pedobacter sp. SYSU D00382]